MHLINRAITCLHHNMYCTRFASTLRITVLQVTTDTSITKSGMGGITID